MTLYPDMADQYREPFLLLNLIRSNPPLFARSYLDKFRSRYTASDPSQPTLLNLYISLDKSRAIQTYEGLYALEELLARLRLLAPLPPLEWSNDLHFAARDHLEDLGPLGLYGHSSSLGLSMFDRFRNYSSLEPGMLAENACFGTTHATEALILMLIDDGDPGARK